MTRRPPELAITAMIPPKENKPIWPVGSLKSSAIISKFCQPRDDPLRVSGPKLSRSSLSPARIPPVDSIDATGLKSGSELYWKRFSLHGAGPAEGQPSTTLPEKPDRGLKQLNFVSSRHARLE
ncbi:uncharacterized protein CCOS01_16060 [Colletotrichum costaricense]|uniref:Uncharacterized protein n=1 Tax=Colletotrichum costaricense TaxID=1209916 RepID=A0AAI9YGF9_9PEZI|nr:uncharacterized protein CCOS01_16060 [Colletotrichum costaricense]KAK1508059.1 hypothetical protein CCOS01_16060 [Colletotrichum costaricense]